MNPGRQSPQSKNPAGKGVKKNLYSAGNHIPSRNKVNL